MHNDFSGTGQSLLADNGQFNLRHVLQKYIRRKWFFFISVVIFLLLALVYIWLKNPLYNIYGTVVIKDQKKGETTNIALRELDFFDEQKIVDNESEIIKSENIVHQVVEKLQLNTGFSVKENFLTYSPLYYNAPFSLSWIDQPQKTPITFELSVKDTATGIYSGKDDLNVKWGDTLLVEGARVIIHSTPSVKNYQGQTIKIVYNTVAAAVQQLRDDIIISQSSKNSSVLNLVMLYPSVQKGRDIINMLFDEYNLLNIADKKKQTDSILEFINTRVYIVYQELAQLESREETFKTNNKITELGADAQLFLDKVKENDIRINEAGIRTELLNTIEAHMLNNKEMVAPPSAAIADPVLTGMVNELRGLYLQKEELSRKVGPENALLKAKENQMAAIRQTILQNIRTQKEGLQETIGQLSMVKNRIDRQIHTVPINERSLTGMIREKNIRENIYTYLLQKREEASIISASAFSNMRVIDSAYNSIKPVKPNKLLVLLGALFAGLVLPVLLINLQPVLQNKVNAYNAISRFTSAPVISTVVRRKKDDPDWVNDQEKQILTEQFRWLRGEVDRRNLTGSAQIIMVTSTAFAEGKSFVSQHLANAFARTEKKTILLDLDLHAHKNTVSQTGKVDTGIAEYLSSSAVKTEEIILTTGNEYLQIISAGNAADFNFDLLGGGRMRALLHYLKSKYDTILIDTAPCSVFSDARQIENMVDTCLFVVRYGVTLIDDLESIQHLYLTNAFKNMYVVNNGVPLQQVYHQEILRHVSAEKSYRKGSKRLKAGQS